MNQKRIQDYGIKIGRLPSGPRNKITDVAGVQVGHSTIHERNHHTGVTVILPGPDNAFSLKYTAASYIHNGFGKSCGLVQIGELGTLETPIALTNTLNTGLVWDALVQYTIDRCQADNVPVYSINPVVQTGFTWAVTDHLRVLGDMTVNFPHFHNLEINDNRALNGLLKPANTSFNLGVGYAF